MKIIAIIALLYLAIDILIGVYLSGFPSFIKYPNLSYIKSIQISGVLEPYARIFASLILFSIIYIMIKSEYISRVTTENAKGTVISISYSDTRMNNKPLVNIEVEYLDQRVLFKNLPGDYGFEFKNGDTIPVKYKKGSPNISTIHEDALEISKQWKDVSP